MKTPKKIGYDLPLFGDKTICVAETFFSFNLTEQDPNLNVFAKDRIKYVAVCIEANDLKTYGIARCSIDDKYDEEKGRKIARSRAVKLFKTVYYKKPIDVGFLVTKSSPDVVTISPFLPTTTKGNQLTDIVRKQKEVKEKKKEAKKK